jgi:Tol biopolymer transport system component
LDLETRELHPLFDLDLQSRPAWTTDPEVISFVDTDVSGVGIYTISLRSNEQHFIVNGNRASWSPDGAFLAIAQRRPATQDGYIRLSISVLDLTKGHKTQVFEMPRAREGIITGLSWSFESNWLALSVQRLTASGTAWQYEIYMVRPDGSDLQQVTVEARNPGWMPADGDWLYFLTIDGQLGFAPRDFSCIVTPLDIVGIDSAAISPSGDRIAFEHSANIYLLNLNELLGPDRGSLACSA